MQKTTPEQVLNKAITGSSENTKVSGNSFTDRSSDLPYVPIVLPDEVERIWIFDHVTPAGDLVTGHWVFVVIKKSRWYIESGYTFTPAPHRVPIPPSANQ